MPRKKLVSPDGMDWIAPAGGHGPWVPFQRTSVQVRLAYGEYLGPGARLDLLIASAACLWPLERRVRYVLCGLP